MAAGVRRLFRPRKVPAPEFGPVHLKTANEFINKGFWHCRRPFSFFPTRSAAIPLPWLPCLIFSSTRFKNSQRFLFSTNEFLNRITTPVRPISGPDPPTCPPPEHLRGDKVLHFGFDSPCPLGSAPQPFRVVRCHSHCPVRLQTEQIFVIPNTLQFRSSRASTSTNLTDASFVRAPQLQCCSAE